MDGASQESNYCLFFKLTAKATISQNGGLLISIISEIKKDRGERNYQIALIDEASECLIWTIGAELVWTNKMFHNVKSK